MTQAPEQLPAIWEKARILSVIIATLAVPVVVAYIGNSLSREQKRDEISAKYVELAIEILKTPPHEDTRALRSWAIDVVNHFSQVPISDEVRRELQRRAYAKEIQRAQSGAEDAVRRAEDMIRRAQLESASAPTAAASGVSAASPRQ